LWNILVHLLSELNLLSSVSPTYFAIHGYGKVMQISQAAITVVEPTWNAGRVKPADNQLWYQDENGIRAKSNGFCLYSTGDGITLTKFCC
jgi:hypothetical protein